MELSHARIREVFPQFNKTALTESDFWRACKREKVVVREMPLAIDGYYQMRRGRHFILLNSRLSGIRWLHTALHEFFHYLLHVPGEYDGRTLYRGIESNAVEKAADAFALIGILPFTELERLAFEGLTEDQDWMLQVIRSRFSVYIDYGL